MSTTRRAVRDPERTRRKLLDAAFEEFCEAGLAGARVERIVARAGVNKRMLYHYFGSKLGLFEALLSDKSGEQRGVREAAPESLGESLAHFQASQASDARWTRLLMWEALHSGPDAIANEAERAAGWAQRVDAIRAAQDARVLPPELDAAQLQLSLVALVTFPVAFPQFTRLITGRAPDDAEFLRQRRDFLRRLGRLIESGARDADALDTPDSGDTGDGS